MLLLAGQKILLRELHPEDLSTMLHWENDPAHWPDSLRDKNLDTSDLHILFLQNRVDVFTTGQKRFAIECVQSKELVGFVDVFKLSKNLKIAETGILIGKEHRQKGYGEMALEQLETYCFGVLGLKTLLARVREKNPASKSLFLKCGYLPVKTVNRKTKSSEIEQITILSKNAQGNP